MVRVIAREHHISVAIVIHDLNLAIRYCDRFLFLRDAQVYACGGGNHDAAECGGGYQIHVHIMEHRGILAVVPLPRRGGG